MVDPFQLDTFKNRFGFHLAVCNTSNKIWILWKADFAVNVLLNEDQLIHLAITHATWTGEVLCSFTYANCSQVGRRHLWSSLLSLSGTLTSKPWLVGGDFNIIADIEEYSVYAPQNLAAINEFAECVSGCGLKTMSALGSRYTWTGIRQGRRVWKLRSDRVLMNVAWQQQFSSSVLQHLNRTGSDHSPLLV
ncbi:uncharacterized protein [Coffea arabica]|uniref:Endonuclease/exonuclease/phosphatase domain-containing protein n=1 Tax=Coffea arabica TaxID=13443 RepID=A0ABM4WPT2_COFAR